MANDSTKQAGEDANAAIPPLLQRTSMRVFLAAIFVMGILRFVLTLAGLPDEFVKFFSMTVVILVAILFFGIATRNHTERLKAAFLLIVPYMIVEVGALSYTWASGRRTIFHAEKYSFSTPIAYHTLGHLVGGVTWEPLTVFVLMETVWGIGALISRQLSHK